MQIKIIYGFGNIKSALYGLVKYASNKYIRDFEDKKSVMSYYFFIKGVVISWYSKK